MTDGLPVRAAWLEYLLLSGLLVRCVSARTRCSRRLGEGGEVRPITGRSAGPWRGQGCGCSGPARWARSDPGCALAGGSRRVLARLATVTTSSTTAITKEAHRCGNLGHACVDVDVGPVQDQLDTDESRDPREPGRQVHQSVQQPFDQEVQRSETEQRERVGHEDDVGLVGDAEDRGDGAPPWQPPCESARYFRRAARQQSAAQRSGRFHGACPVAHVGHAARRTAGVSGGATRLRCPRADRLRSGPAESARPNQASASVSVAAYHTLETADDSWTQQFWIVAGWSRGCPAHVAARLGYHLPR